MTFLCLEVKLSQFCLPPVTCPGEVRTLQAKFGPDLPTGLGLHSEQANKQTDRQFYIYINYYYLNYSKNPQIGNYNFLKQPV